MATFDAELASRMFILRYLEEKKKKKIRNEALIAGSPMYYYCHGCTILVATLPEGWWRTPPPHYCDACVPLSEHGLLGPLIKRANELESQFPECSPEKIVARLESQRNIEHE